MSLKKNLKLIEMPSRISFAILDFCYSDQNFEDDRTLFYFNEEKLFHKISQTGNPNLYMLVFLCRIMDQTEQIYKKQWISDKIFVDSMKDLTIWAESYFERTQTYGVDQWHWLALTMKGKVFRLGRLQFEPKLLTEAITKGNDHFSIGTKYLKIHIPAGNHLSNGLVSDSLKQASEHWLDYQIGICESWLLAPALIKILSSNSNILQFQRRFILLNTDLHNKQAEERIFNFVQDIKHYPAQTSLQKKAQSFLLSGKKIGTAKGYLFLKS
ncbi:acyltransferase domain-containing protein [Xylocopilactobacillus apis]|uniref:Uncharacterized protein n=1 Tax=Xylocopilactobacillus apis TaxID=2932183 RepID=A0AAU9CXQ9_9LACO|nr:acyltransferase domain-containing protein [Xylocopilactobacillus apis]BDR56169.1 hypothetical protein KIMC2_07310 [Xylocopilactobacillus apis]